ncbi:putative F-box protein At5g52610 [Salvia miltiorrhiza]|uniref:putative F-box protein At5g52610 n=1 Tax=Salvia miltiorrhiza TaxID=226208 RepID=UPI0025ABE365|nr:putative F-box protein At5g52610 [Salvia miltiorrhiza]
MSLIETGGKNKNGEVILAEIIMEVLSWLPIKPLARAQLVCKQWRALIKDHKFMEEHMNRSQVVHNWFNITSTHSELAPNYISMSYLHGCNGLVLMKNNTSHNYMLWNPATALVLDLPAPHEGNYGFALSFMPLSRNYKIVSLFKDSGKRGCELLTPGGSMAWRPLPFPDLVNTGEELVVPAGAAVHCVVLAKAGEAEIVSLDVETEVLTLNRLPRGVFSPRESARAIDWDGKLAFAAVVGQDLQLMVLQDYKKKRWCRDKEVIPLPFLKDKAFKGNTVVALFKKEGSIWFWLKNEKVFEYTIETGKTSDVQQSKGFSPLHKLYSFKPSLVTFEGMRADDEFKIYRPHNLWLD